MNTENVNEEYKQLWKPFDCYQISNKGTIVSYKRSNHPHVLSHQLTSSGIHRVVLKGSDGTIQSFQVARLVAICFLKGRFRDRYLVYRDGDYNNLDSSNLMWTAYRPNLQVTGSKKGTPLRCVETNKLYSSKYEAAKDLKVSVTRIYQVINTSNTCKGYHFRTESL